MAQFPYLYFQTAADDAIAIPVAAIDGMDIAATALTITATHNFVQYKAILTVTAAQDVLNAIAKFAHKRSNEVVVITDDVDTTLNIVAGLGVTSITAADVG